MFYTAQFEPDGEGWLVTFPALPEAITGGPCRQEARRQAADALEVVLLTYVKDGRNLPPDSQAEGDSERVPVSAQVVAKLAFIQAFRLSGMSRVALAARMRVSESEVRRLLDPYYGSKLPTLEAGMLALGKRYVLTVEAA